MARSGLTTGTCATAALTAAARLLSGNGTPTAVEVFLPRAGGTVSIPIRQAWQEKSTFCATVVKDAGDDPDVTHGLVIGVRLEQLPTEGQTTFVAGPGVGTITRPGLSFPVGEPAINPVPRQMMIQALQQESVGPCRITVFVEGGEEAACRTFNPRLGILGGISILGTTGIVRPYCRKAMCDAIRVNLQVVRASSLSATLVPGNIGYQSAQQHWLCPPDTLVEVGNEWQAGLLAALQCDFTHLRLVGHPGKLAKMAQGEFYTHSHHSESALPYLHRLARSHGLAPDTAQATAEGFFATLPPEHRTLLSHALRHEIAHSVRTLFQSQSSQAPPHLEIHLIRMDGTPLV